MFDPIEERVPAQAFIVKAKCPDCDTGYLRITNGPVLATYPPQFQHQCDKCGADHWIRGARYPNVAYDEAKPDA
jgi:uncharacterized protein with PIN domain